MHRNAYYNWREAPIEMYSPLLTLFTTNLSQPLSIVYGLERTYGVAALENMRVLTVDIVGATNSFEAQFPDKYEEILHLLPRLRELHLRFIGPTLRAPAAPASSSSSSSASMHAGNSSSSSSSSGEGHVFTHPLCDDCSGRKYTISFHSSMYHDFLASAASSSSSSPSTAPSLIVAFNSGLHLFEQGSSNDTWDATLRAMLSHNDTPVLLTSYSKEEQILDSARLEAYDANFVMQPTLNPFRSLLPQREPTGLPEQPHYYHNQYIFAVKGTGSASASAAGGSGGRGDGKWTLAAAKIPYIDLIKMSQK